MEKRETNGNHHLEKTNIPFWRQLRWNLVIYFVLLVVLPMAGVTGILIQRTTAETTRDVTDHLSSVSQLKIDQIKNWLENTQDTLRLTAAGPNGAKFSSLLLATSEDETYTQQQSEVSDLLKDSAGSQDFFNKFILYDTKGKVIAASDETDIGKIISNRPYYDNSLVGEFIQSPYYALATGELNMVATRPMVDENGKTVGVLAGQLDLRPLNDIMIQRAGLGQTGETYLISAESNYLLTASRFEEAGYIATRAYHSQGIDSALQGEDGAGVYEDYREPPVRVVGVYRWVPELQAALMAEQNVSEALAAATATRNFIIAVASGFALLAAGIGLYVATRVSNPVNRLTEVASRIASGDLTARARTEVSNEIGILANTFNAMVERVSSLLTDVQERSAELEERTRELEASQRVTFAASERATPEEILGLVVELIRDQFQLYHAQVYIVDEEQQAAVLRQSTGYAGRQLLQRKHKIPLEATALVTKAIQTAEPVLVDDTGADPNFMPNPLLPDTKSELVVPLQRDEQVIGVLDVQDREPGRFDESTINLFQSMTDQVAMLFENAELMERVSRRTDALTAFTNQLRTATQIARRLNTILDPERLARETVEMLQSRFGLYHAHIYLLNERTRELNMHVGSGEVGRVLKERGHSIDLDAEKSLVARAAHGRHTVAIDDTSLESDFMPNPLLPETRSEVAVPLIVGDDVLGVLDVQDNQPNRFSEADVDTLGILAGQIATAMQTAALFEQTQTRLKVSQSLTGAQTEDEVLDVMLQQASLYPEAQVALMLIDADADKLTAEVVRTDAAQSGLPPVPAGTRFTKESLPALQYLTPTEDFVVDDVEADERMDQQSREFMTKMGIRSGANIPIAVGDVWLGELVINARKENFFDKQKLNLYQTLAEQGARVLQIARLHEATAESERQYSELLNGLRDGFAVVSMDGKVTDCNTAFEEIVGYSLDELREMTFSDLTVEEYRDMEARILEEQALTRGYTDLYEKEYYRKDGTTVPVELTVYAVEDAEGNPDGFWGFIRDITERKQAEEQIKTFQTLTETSTDGILMADLEDQQITYANQAAHKLFGCDYESREMIGIDGARFWPEEERQRLPQVLEQAMGEGWQGDLQQRRLDGSQFAANATAFALQDAEGNPTDLVIMVRDITERKQAEERVKESEERLSRVVDNMAVMLDVLDEDGNILVWNKECERVTGYTAEEIVGNPKATELLYPDKEYREAMFERWAKRADEDFYNWEWEVVCKDGTVKTLSWSKVSNRAPIPGWPSWYTAVDVTERKRAEEARERFTTRLETAAEISEQVGSILDPDELLETVIPLIKEEFGLYYVHVYTMDEESGMLNLRAGYGEAGEKMLSEGHAIPVDREASLVASAARTKEPVLVDDVTEDPNFMPNPLLPDTKTEVAVPAIAGGEVLGVFDVQHDEANYFTDADLDVFQTLAGQIANAFQSAALLEEMTEAQTRFRTVADFTYDWEYWVGTDGEFIYVSPACERITGYSVEEFIEDPTLLEQITHPEDIDLISQHTHLEMEHEEAHEVEFRVTTRDGEERWIGHACQPVYGANGEYLGRRASNRDITEQKEAEAEREEQRALLNSILSSLPVGVWVSDKEFNVLLTNEYQREMMGRQIVGEGGEAIVERYDVINLETGELYDESKLPIVQTMSDGEPHMADDMGIRWPDGKMVPVMTTTGPLVDAEGDRAGTVAITQDITERKQAEERIRESQQLLNSFLNNFPDLAFAKDKDGVITLANRVLEETYPVPDGELIGKTVYDLVPDEVADGIWASELEILESGEAKEVQEVVPQGDEIRTKLTTKFPLYDAGGNVQGLGGVSVDITERRKAEEERQRFTTRLDTAARISEQVGSILDPDELLETVIPLIKEEFGLYYVHVYTMDEESGMLNLRAGYGEAGDKMLAEGHAIPVDREASLVASAARTMEPVLVDDVTEDPNFMPNPLLPDTKTEVAVPSIAGGEVLGVFDVQHDEAHYFTDADLDVFQTLAAQIANAFRSAELLEDMEASEQRFRGLYEASPLGIALNDYETGDYLGANEALLEMVGYTLDELNALSYWDLTPKKYDEDEQTMIRLMEKTGRYGPYEKEYIHKNGDVIPVVLNGVVVTDQTGRKLIWSTVEDITERKEAQAELERLGLAIEQTADGVAISDLKGNLQFANQAFAEMHGYSVDEIKGKSLAMFHTEEQLKNEVLPFNEKAMQKGLQEGEVGHMRRDGTTFPTQMTVATIKDESGNTIGLSATARDITERKRIERAVLTERDRAQTYLDVAGTIIVAMNEEGNVTLLNKAGLEVLGYDDEEEVIGQNWFDLTIPEEISDDVKAVFQKIMAGEMEQAEYYENEVVTKSGEQRIVAWHNSLLKDEDGNITGVLSSGEDITERKQAELERQRFTTQLRTAADLAEEVNSILDPDQLLPRVVDELQERFDLYHVHIYTLEQPPTDLLEQADTDEVSRIMRERNLVMSAGSGEVGQQMLEQGHAIPLIREKSLVARAARSQKHVLVNNTSKAPDFMPNPLLPETRAEIAVPLVAGEEVLGVLDVQDNQPDRFTQADVDVLSTMAGQIATALQNAGYFEEIQKTAERLREVDLVKSEFLASMSHELRTPLNSIIGYTEIMLMGIDTALDAETLEDVQAIYDNAQHLLRIINDVLDLTKIEAGRLEMEMGEVSIEDLIEAASKSVAGLMVDEKAVEFRVEAEDDLPVIWGDRRRLDQILNNLISNAVKFTEEGHVTLRAFAEDGWINLEVEDTGIGIAKEDHKKVFDRFQQLDQTVTKQREGTGLGLAITRELVQLHGGTIKLESEAGKGATFTVSLPVK